MQKVVLAGILSIISGVFGVSRLLLELLYRWFRTAPATPSPSDYALFSFLQFILTLSFIWQIIAAVAGILAIVGGILAVKKRLWGLTFAGAIAATVAFFPCGVPAIIFLALYKDEFSTIG